MSEQAKNPQHILARLKQAAQCPTDAALAAFLGITHQALSRARSNGKIPSAWIPLIAEKTDVSADWLFFGRGSMHPEQASSAGEIPTPSPPTFPLNMRKIHDAENVDLVLLPLVAARLAAGSGSLESGGELVGRFAFRSDWVYRKGNPEKMVLMRVTGDSMEPEIRHGDMVLIDREKTQIYGHALYAVGVNDEIYIKEIETLPGRRLVLRSLNSRYTPIEIDLRGDLADSVRIIGRILWWCREA
ncbi:MAG: helix-turn-helix transcriptional regulator [Desulfovibrionaceae bacterium]|nr:helix-turn-helix transcriptional regulator [Desulfovibrionaceae bacterium]